MSPPRKVFIRTYGCQMNEYDSARMADVLRDSHGYERTQSPEEAILQFFFARLVVGARSAVRIVDIAVAWRAVAGVFL